MMDENRVATDHDLLIRLDEKTDSLVESHKTHLSEHFKIRIGMATTVVAALVAIFIAVL